MIWTEACRGRGWLRGHMPLGESESSKLGVCQSCGGRELEPQSLETETVCSWQHHLWRYRPAVHKCGSNMWYFIPCPKKMYVTPLHARFCGAEDRWFGGPGEGHLTLSVRVLEEVMSQGDLRIPWGYPDEGWGELPRRRVQSKPQGQ